MTNKESNIVTITGDSSWWSRVLRSLLYSHEKSSGDSTSTSFLSCAFFDLDDERTTISSESATSTAAITVNSDDDVVTAGNGKFLVPISSLNQYVSSMPSGDITLEFNSDDMEYTVTNDTRSVQFSAGLVEIISEDMTPQADTGFPEEAETVTVDGAELIDAYRSSSTMALPIEKDPLSGQDPMAGCYMVVNDDGIQMFSLSVSAAESLVYVPGERTTSSLITAPNTTLPRFGVFSNSENTSLAIVNNMLHIGDGSIHMVLTPLNTGERKVRITVDQIMKVMDPAWKAGVVDISLPSQEFFTALNRADSVGDRHVEVEVTDTSLTLSSTGKNNSTVPFKQKMTCSTVWLDDADHWLSFKFHIDTVKSLSSTVGKREMLRFRVSLKPNGQPWAMVIITDEHDDENPHDYQMISLTK